MLRAYSVALVICAALAPAGCGSDDAEAPDAREETAQPVPELPRGWRVDRNATGGFALGVPPGWRAAHEGAATRLSAPGRVAVVTVTPDRSDEALESGLEELAGGTAAAYGESFEAFESGEPRRYRHAYDAFAVKAEGRNEGNDQELDAILVRREGLVTFTVFVQQPRGSGAVNRPEIDRAVRSIRSRPPG